LDDDHWGLVVQLPLLCALGNQFSAKKPHKDGAILKEMRRVDFQMRLPCLLDTGAAVTDICNPFARHCKLLQTGESELRALGAQHRCGEHAGTIALAGSNLRRAEAISIRSVDFIRGPNFARFIGQDILRNWKITFDEPFSCVTILD
jgi:hypothetical protein